MKKVLLALVVLATGVAANAQKVNFGVKGGYNLSMVSATGESADPRSTFHVGGIANFSLNKTWSIQPQVLVSGKGANIAHEGHADKFKFLSLDVPVNAIYSFNNGLFVGAGPNFGFNLSGKFEADENGQHIEQDIKFGSGADQINRFDFGVNALVGYKLKNKLFFSANYTAGLSNWSNQPSTTWRNSVLGVSVGYFFN
jgi:hypothetical protein